MNITVYVSDAARARKHAARYLWGWTALQAIALFRPLWAPAETWLHMIAWVMVVGGITSLLWIAWARATWITGPIDEDPEERTGIRLETHGASRHH